MIELSRIELRILIDALDVMLDGSQSPALGMPWQSMRTLRARLVQRADQAPPQNLTLDPRVTPTAVELDLGYQLVRPIPFLKNAVQHSAELVCGYREGLIVQLLEPLARRMPPAQAAQLRAVIHVIRGELKPSDLEIKP